MYPSLVDCRCADDIYTFDVILEAEAAENRLELVPMYFVLGFLLSLFPGAWCRWELKRHHKMHHAPEMPEGEAYDMRPNDAAK